MPLLAEERTHPHPVPPLYLLSRNYFSRLLFDRTTAVLIVGRQCAQTLHAPSRMPCYALTGERGGGGTGDVSPEGDPTLHAKRSLRGASVGGQHGEFVLLSATSSERIYLSCTILGGVARCSRGRQGKDKHVPWTTYFFFFQLLLLSSAPLAHILHYD